MISFVICFLIVYFLAVPTTKYVTAENIDHKVI